jgi:hypothetical protein
MTTPYQLLPIRIEWAGPEGTRVLLDEDGVQLRFANGGLEECDVDRLLEVIAVAKATKQARTSETPRPPTKDEQAALPDWRGRRIAHDAIKAIKASVGIGVVDAPF